MSVCADSDASKSRLSLELYVILDASLLVGTDIRQVLENVIHGGADAVQFRAKRLSKRRYYETATSLLPIARRNGVSFFVNDHLDVALALSSDGIHLGQNDLPCGSAKKIMPSQMLLGISTHCPEEAARAAKDGADYVAIGSVFPTSTKKNPEAVVGTRTVEEVRKRVGEVPLIAIGGINAENAAEVIRAGADGVAVASAVLLDDDPQEAARELKRKIRNERRAGA